MVSSDFRCESLGASCRRIAIQSHNIVKSYGRSLSCNKINSFVEVSGTVV